MGRAFALAYGLISYLIFFISFVYAIGFLGNFAVPKSIDSGHSGSIATAVIIDLVLMGLFAVQHSVMARPWFKRWWTRFIPSIIERSTYVLLASLALLLLYWQWQPLSGALWNVSAPVWRTVIWVIFAVGWTIVFLSTFMIGHFELLGLTQVYRNLRGQGLSEPEFREPGFYKLVRHPIMLGFIIAFWATPTMTIGHALFAATTAVYILIALQFEEHDLMATLGGAYVDYRGRVPGLIPFAKGVPQRVKPARATQDHGRPE